jgi:hypothetical protein
VLEAVEEIYSASASAKTFASRPETCPGLSTIPDAKSADRRTGDREGFFRNQISLSPDERSQQ